MCACVCECEWMLNECVVRWTRSGACVCMLMTMMMILPNFSCPYTRGVTVAHRRQLIYDVRQAWLVCACNGEVLMVQQCPSS